MELVLTARGTRITEQFRAATQHKLAHLERIEPRLARLEIEVISEKNPRRGGLHRVQALAATPREHFRAHAEAREVGSALDVVTERLERQIRDHQERRRTHRKARAGRVESARVQTSDSDEEEDVEDTE
jgi:ribosomal subunit interface protein